jgi:hypothetical protein
MDAWFFYERFAIVLVFDFRSPCFALGSVVHSSVDEFLQQGLLDSDRVQVDVHVAGSKSGTIMILLGKSICPCVQADP